MSSAAFSGEIGRRVAALAKSGPGLDPADIKEVVESVLASMDLDLTTGNLKVYSEIQGLAQFIRDLKTEIATLRPDDVTEEHLPAANDELEAVVGATEKATNEIFEAVEAIEALAEKMDGKVAEQVNEAVTKVYEACSFQDITGQRIGKVVGALQQVEVKMQALLEAFGAEIASTPFWPEWTDRPCSAPPWSPSRAAGTSGARNAATPT
jgi:chemotaxis protein CheZ